jgi:two-component system, cell cycle response regulator DivK
MLLERPTTTILFVEDNTDSFWILEDMLVNEIGAGCVEGCASGVALLARIAQMDLTPDVILLDLQMPKLDGFAVLERLRARPELAAVPIVAVTANVMPRYVERARQAGFSGFIGKPLLRNRFGAQMRRILAGEVVWEPT